MPILLSLLSLSLLSSSGIISLSMALYGVVIIGCHLIATAIYIVTSLCVILLSMSWASSHLLLSFCIVTSCVFHFNCDTIYIITSWKKLQFINNAIIIVGTICQRYHWLLGSCPYIYSLPEGLCLQDQSQHALYFSLSIPSVQVQSHTPTLHPALVTNPTFLLSTSLPPSLPDQAVPILSLGLRPCTPLHTGYGDNPPCSTTPTSFSHQATPGPSYSCCSTPGPSCLHHGTPAPSCSCSATPGPSQMKSIYFLS